MLPVADRPASPIRHRHVLPVVCQSCVAVRGDPQSHDNAVCVCVCVYSVDRACVCVNGARMGDVWEKGGHASPHRSKQCKDRTGDDYSPQSKVSR